MAFSVLHVNHKKAIPVFSRGGGALEITRASACGSLMWKISSGNDSGSFWLDWLGQSPTGGSCLYSQDKGIYRIMEWGSSSWKAWTMAGQVMASSGACTWYSLPTPEPFTTCTGCLPKNSDHVSLLLWLVWSGKGEGDLVTSNQPASVRMIFQWCFLKTVLFRVCSSNISSFYSISVQQNLPVLLKNRYNPQMSCLIHNHQYDISLVLNSEYRFFIILNNEASRYLIVREAS